MINRRGLSSLLERLKCADYYNSTRLLLKIVIISLALNICLSLPVSANDNFSIQLNKGWNLLSLPMWAEKIDFKESDIEAWLTYKDGDWFQADSKQDLVDAINNPTRAVYIKAARPTAFNITWAEMAPHNQFASQGLSPGWNLISSGLRVDYLTVLASVYDDGNGGVSKIFAPNDCNRRKEEGYSLRWGTKLNTLSDPNQATPYDMYPFDGYWVYLRGGEVVFSTPVGSDIPDKIKE